MRAEIEEKTESIADAVEERVSDFQGMADSMPLDDIVDIATATAERAAQGAAVARRAAQGLATFEVPAALSYPAPEV